MKQTSNHYRIDNQRSSKTIRIKATIEGKDPARQLSNKLDSVVKTSVSQEDNVKDVIMSLNEFDDIEAVEDQADEKTFTLKESDEE